MGGLLYKDFVLVKGKQVVTSLIIMTVIYTVLRVVFPEIINPVGYTLVDQDGREFNEFDLFFWMGWIFLFAFSIALLGRLVIDITRDEEKNKIRNYIFAMPIDKNAYFASKFIFIGIATYIFLSLNSLWIVVGSGFSQCEIIHDMFSFGTLMSLAMSGVALILAGCDLRMFIVYGRDKAMMVKISVELGVGLFVVGYLFFGDLTVLEKLDLEKIIEWCKDHSFELMMFEILSPVISLLIYYSSYKRTCKAMSRKEVSYD